MSGKRKKMPNERLARLRQTAILQGGVSAWGVEELAISIGCSPGHIRNSIASGALPASRVGRRVLILAKDAEEWIARLAIHRGANEGASAAS